MSLRRLAPLLLVALAACARPALRGPPGARTPFMPGRTDGVFAAVMQVLREGGYRVESCDAGLARATTDRIERDAPCGRTTCLARQIVNVKLGHRAARLAVVRQYWDHAAKEWVAIRDDDVSRTEAALLGEALSRAVAGPWTHARQEWPADPCAGGTAVASVSARQGVPGL